jgi:hypothetical protein
MCAGQPLSQKTSRFIRGRTIERHEGCGDPRNVDDAGSPAIGGDGRHLNEVWPAANAFLKPMNSSAHVGVTDAFELLRKRDEFYVRATADQAKRSAKADVRTCASKKVAEDFAKNIFGVRVSTGYSRVIHRFSTTCREAVAS